MEKIIKKYKKILKDIKILNLATVSYDNLLASAKRDEILNLININILSNVYLTQLVLPLMITQRKGKIVHFSSTRALEGDIGISLYALSKTSLIGFSNSIAKEYARFNITSNIITLGYFDGKLLDNIPNDIKKKLLKKIPSKKLGRHKDIIRTLDFIFSCNYLNGANIKLDGGI